jgi:Lar family restriction alleviation protein
MSAPVLKPCPFCGDENGPQMRRMSDDKSLTCDDIQCDSCGAIGPVWNCIGVLDGAEHQACLIDEWNERAAS